MKKMRILVFGEGLLLPALQAKDQKQITIRNYRPEAHDFKKGETVIGEFKDGLNVLLEITEDTEKKLFSRLTDEEGREDGFRDAQDAFEGLKHWYPNLEKSDTAAIVRFRIFSLDGVPAVATNDYSLELVSA